MPRKMGLDVKTYKAAVIKTMLQRIKDMQIGHQNKIKLTQPLWRAILN